MTTTRFLPELTCRICGKPIDRDEPYLPEGDLNSYSHPQCYVTEWRARNEEHAATAPSGLLEVAR